MIILARELRVGDVFSWDEWTADKTVVDISGSIITYRFDSGGEYQSNLSELNAALSYDDPVELIRRAEMRTPPDDNDPRWTVMKELDAKVREAHGYLKSAEQRYERCSKIADDYRRKHFLYEDDEEEE